MARFESQRYPSFVFVQTDFVRRNAPIFVCAVLEPRRRIKLSWEARGLPLHEQIEIAQELAVQHFVTNAGWIEFWGNIQGYLFQYSDDQTPIAMTTTGQIVAESDNVPPTAKITIRGKNLEPFIKQ
ncbi:MAG: hypothetical protein ACSHXK_13985 [Oceanococcus sp.]